MKIRILGSGAAEGVPALWCKCDFCEKVRKLGGKDFRRRTSYLIDDDVMVDFGPDAMWQLHDFQIDVSKVKYFLLTHPHSDHIAAWDIGFRMPGFSHKFPPVTFCGSRGSIAFINDYWQMVGVTQGLGDAGITPVYLRHNESMVREDLKVTALDANHPSAREPMLFIIERGGKKLLIGNDTGYLLDQTFDVLTGAELDGAILDCTGGLAGAGWTEHHMGAATLLKVREELLHCGGLRKDAVVVANHFSHNGAPLQESLEGYFRPYGVLTGYDGMEFTL